MSLNTFEHINKIEEHLYLGDYMAIINSQCLRDNKIAMVLSVVEDMIPSDLRVDGIHYKYIKASDFDEQELLTYFPQTFFWIDYYIKNCGNVFVHCHAGISRSATIVIAYVMQKYKMSVQSAIDLVKSKRNIIYPNIGFKNQLILFKEMDFTLDAKNPQLRHFLIRCYLYYKTFKQDLRKYFDRRSLAEGMNPNLDFGQQYDCSNCGFKLFNEIHIIERDDSNPDNNCLKVHIEPQKWMEKDLIAFDGKAEYGHIVCNNCTENKAKFFAKSYLEIEMIDNSYVKHQ